MRMRKLRLLSACLCALLLASAETTSPAWAQTSGTNEWTWMGGSKTLQPGAYGTMGTASATNLPGGRSSAVSWTDNKGNLWLFGGSGTDSTDTPGFLNDIWEYSTSTNEWTWVAGSDSVGGFGQASPAVPGTLGTPAAGNTPEGRQGAVGWTDSKGNLWLFGGFNYAVTYFNDLWEFEPSTGEWAWMGGSATSKYASPGVYGTLGTAAATNIPGSRENAVSWIDSHGNFWLFGGFGLDSVSTVGSLNDLWEFNPSTNQWTWMGGGTTIPLTCNNGQCGQSGVYGTLGTPAAGNIPGARDLASGWTDSSGNFWLFGGEGTDSAGTYGVLNDMWKFNPATGQWAWMGGTSTFAGICLNYEVSCGVPGVYGQLQTPAQGNIPGSRSGAASWTDSAGNLWLFGGDGVDSAGNWGEFDDLWQFNPSTNEWEWMSGSTVLNCSIQGQFCGEPGVYGTLQTPGLGNTPSGRTAAASWTDNKGNLWLFAGTGLDLVGVPGSFDDLWEYQPNTGGLPITAAPTFSPPPGNYTTEQSITISDTTPGATIYYIVNGNAPASEYTGPIPLTSQETIEAIAGANGFANSNVAAATYTTAIPATSAPVFRPGSGTYATAQTVTLSDATQGAKIYYTTDNSLPTTNSEAYAGPITVTLPVIIQAIAVSNGDLNSAVASAVYTIGPSSTLGEWTWLSGSSGENQAGIYGTLKTPNAGNIPGARYESTGWTDQNGNFWLFGGWGHDASGSTGYLNDLWSFNPSTRVWTWMGGSSTVPCSSSLGVTNCTGQTGMYGTLKTPAAGSIPGGRFGGTGWTDSHGHFWLFGGYGVDSTGEQGDLNDLWEFDPSTGEWTWMGGQNKGVPTLDTEDGFPGVFGSLGVPAAANIPGGRYNAASWSDSNGNFWLFGGTGQDVAGAVVTLNDFWRFDLSTNEWTWMGGSNAIDVTLGFQSGTYGTLGVPSESNFPGSRTGAAAWTDGNGNLWMFGGNGGGSNGNLNDFWSYNPSTNEWTWMSGAAGPYCVFDPLVSLNACSDQPGAYGALGTPSPASTPGGGNNFSSWTDQNGNFWLFGGVSSDITGQNGGFYTGNNNALWVFNPSTYEWAWMGGDYATSNCFWVVSLVTYPACSGSQGVYGSLGVPAAGNIPAALFGGVNWRDKSGNLWLFSGQILDLSDMAGVLNELWEYQPAPTTLPPAATPIFSLFSATPYARGGPLQIANGMSAASIYYTTDGSTPTAASNLYTGALTLASSETVQAMAAAPGYRNSSVASANYALVPETTPATPVIAVASGTYTSAQTVAITDTTANATIYYTTDGTTPIPSSPVYTAPIVVSASETITALAVTLADGNVVLDGIAYPGAAPDVSGAATAKYIINLPQVATPAFSVAAGTYTSAQSITISDATVGAAIYYTTNGATPTATSTLYSGPINVTATETIEAVAIVSGDTNSNVATAAYVITAPPGFAITGTAITVAPGATTGNTSTITLTPSGGFTGAINLSCAITPVAANEPATCGVLATATITGAVAQTTTLTVNTTAATSALNQAGKPFWPFAGSAALACILLVSIPARRRRWQRILGMLVLLFSIAGGVFACGGGGSGGGGGGGGGGGNAGTTPGTYTVTVTGTSGAITESGAVTLTVQ